MKIAILGATGLVGSALVKAAQDAGHEVVALSCRCCCAPRPASSRVR